MKCRPVSARRSRSTTEAWRRSSSNNSSCVLHELTTDHEDTLFRRVIRGPGVRRAFVMYSRCSMRVRPATVADLPFIVEANRALAEESEGVRLDVAVLRA